MVDSGTVAIGITGGISGFLNGITKWFYDLSLFEWFLIGLVVFAVFFIFWGLRQKKAFSEQRLRNK